MTASSAILTPTDPAWAARTDLDVYLRPQYTQLEADWTGGTAIALVLSRSSESLLIPLIERPTPAGNVDWVSPYGYPWEGPSLLGSSGEAWLKLMADVAAERGASSIFLRTTPTRSGAEPLEQPEPRSHGLGSFHPRLVNQTYSISFTSEDLLDQYSSGIRRDVRRAMREPLNVSVHEEWHADQILDLYHSSLDRLDAGSYHYFTASYLAQLCAAAGRDQFLCVVTSDATLLSFGVFFTASSIAQYHISAGNSEHPLRGYATKLMLHSAAEECRLRGARELHLGGAPGNSSGLDDLKRRFSTDTNDYVVVQIIPDQSRYENEICAAEQTSPPSSFPAYRSPTT